MILHWIATDWHWAWILGITALIALGLWLGDLGDVADGLFDAFD